MPLLPDDELGRIADPPLIRRRRRKLPVEQIGRDRLVVIAHGGHFVPLARPRLQAVFLHQSDHALAAHALLLLDQIFVNARAAVPLLALVERGLHQDLQSAIVTGMRRFRATVPGVEAAARHAQTATENGDRMLGPLRRDEGKPHRLCFAKKAAAFFRISRSSWTIAQFFPESHEFLALRGRQARLALGPIGARLLDPVAERRLRQAQVARHSRDRLALIEDQSDGPRLVVRQ